MPQWPAPYPKPGDIVWCHFPNYGNDPTLKERPALVVSVMDTVQPVRLRVAYGTTKRPLPVGKGCFVIQEEAHRAQAGLAGVTRFDMKNIVLLPYDTEHFMFAPLPGGKKRVSPVMGTLPAVLMTEVQRAAAEAGLLKPPAKRPPTR